MSKGKIQNDIIKKIINEIINNNEFKEISQKNMIILIQLIKEEKKSESGIIIKNSAIDNLEVCSI